MRALLVASILIVASIASVPAAEPVKFDKSQLIGGEVPRQYRPDYPVEARRLHETGSGVFILHINEKTGEVTSITVQKSTGYKLLDAAALKACINWRFKPHTVTKVRMPMTFSMRAAFP